MPRTELFRQQHESIIALAQEITWRLDPSVLASNARDTWMLLSTLSGKLGTHLAMEDRSLYPSLLNHSDQKVKHTAREFITEMGTISQAYSSYKVKWATSSSIQEAPDIFVKETRQIFSALRQRVDKENKILYPLLDTVE
jgi:iron-sulfur cluster repair protein YtfE (RIC family)